MSNFKQFLNGTTSCGVNMEAVYFLHICGSDGCFQLRKRDKNIPPNIQIGMGVGFESHSTFNYDEFRVRRLHWNLRLSELHVEFETFRFSDFCFLVGCNYLKDGWEPHLTIESDSLEDALADWDENEGQGYAVVEFREKFYWVNQIELRLLGMFREQFIIFKDITNQ